MDFFTVPTISFKLLHVLVMIENHRRRIIHFNVTENPTSIWSVQLMRNALFNDNSYKYVIRDRDCKFGKYFREKINDVGIKEIVTAYRSPW